MKFTSFLKTVQERLFLMQLSPTDDEIMRLSGSDRTFIMVLDLVILRRLDNASYDHLT